MISIKQLAWLSVLLLCACSPVTTNSSLTAASPSALSLTPTCQIVCKVNENNSATPPDIQPTSEFLPRPAIRYSPNRMRL